MKKYILVSLADESVVGGAEDKEGAFILFKESAEGSVGSKYAIYEYAAMGAHGVVIDAVNEVNELRDALDALEGTFEENPALDLIKGRIAELERVISRGVEYLDEL